MLLAKPSLNPFWRDVGAQLRHPSGLRGRLTGMAMARANAKPNRLALAALGLRNGDVIEMVNGIKLDDPTKGLEMFQSLKNQSHFTINLKRYNNKMTLTYDVR